MSTGPRWQKSSFSGGGDSSDCVELAVTNDGTVRIRESDAPAQTLSTTRHGLAALLRSVREGHR